MEVMESFENSNEDRSQTGLIISEASGLASKFYYFKAQFVPRACNQVADKLARSARVMNDQTWYNKVPDIVKDVMALDSVIE